MKKILIINGPNLNLLGEREPGIYGDDTYETLCSKIMDKAENMEIKCEIFQSNHEGAIIDKLHSARLSCDGVVLNAGAFTHYSYAVRDPLGSQDGSVGSRQGQHHKQQQSDQAFHGDSSCLVIFLIT